jgi:Uma2 family endonuclease
MTYAEFLDWADEDTLAEWVDGKVIATSPANRRHQELVGFLYGLLDTYAKTHDLGIVLPVPFQMHLPTSGREPDVLFVAKAHQDRLKASRIEGPADLVVEVVSPESRGRDRGDKFYEYQLGGMKEYWLIDPDTRHADFHQIDDAAGVYRIVPPSSRGIYRSQVLEDFQLPLPWLWQAPLPSINEAMLAIDGPAHAARMIADLKDGGFLP